MSFDMLTPVTLLAAEFTIIANAAAFIDAMGEPSAVVMAMIGIAGVLVGRMWSSHEARKARD